MVVLAERIRTSERDFARGELVGFAGPALLARESDERLAALVRDGDHNAFAAIVARYRLPLERHCRRTLPPSRAEDALQQTFAKAYVALSEGAQPIALKAWLYAIAHNTSLNGLRDRDGESLEAAGEFGAHHQTHDIVARRESLRSLVRAVGSLPSRQRQVLVRQEFEGASQEQIAAELGLSTGAVRQLAHRARSTVRAAAAAMIPAPLWRLFPWQLGYTGGKEVALSSAFAAVVGKSAVVLLMATAAGGAVQLTTGIPGATAPAHSRVSAPRAPSANGAIVTRAGSVGTLLNATGASGGPTAGHPAAAARPGRAGAGAAGAQGTGAGADSSAADPSAGEPAVPAAGSGTGTGRQPQGSGSDVVEGSTAAQSAGAGHQDSSASHAPDQPDSSSAHEIDLLAADAPDAPDAPDPPDPPDAVDVSHAPDTGVTSADSGSTPPGASGSTPGGSASTPPSTSTSTSTSGSSG